VAAVAPPWTRKSSSACGNATTRPFPPGLPTTGCGTGTIAATGIRPRDLAARLERTGLAVRRRLRRAVTNNVSERGAKAAKRHQAVSGCWHTLATFARWCRIRSYLDSAAAHGVAAIDAIRAVIEGRPWLPPLPAAAWPAPGAPAAAASVTDSGSRGLLPRYGVCGRATTSRAGCRSGRSGMIPEVPRSGLCRIPGRHTPQ
jgi:hypothetical protein